MQKGTICKGKTVLKMPFHVPDGLCQRRLTTATGFVNVPQLGENISNMCMAAMRGHRCHKGACNRNNCRDMSQRDGPAWAFAAAGPSD
jgi:hypothetical protein